MNGIEVTTSVMSPSAKSFGLSDGTSPDNMDVVPAGTGPSNNPSATSITQIVDTYLVQIS